ncbi:GNAT family N-acetyltransferase [Sulfitobacter aestuariivivens]|uniref:GNAT family N-acetyltransferase n=1 Tax=Sulfitobacter aestuariivivens TaxID=2766981 RepID=A0A927D5N1_9RHOB|nr:GNAT family N-acetyltransferase [Sulfitobacter aestuariivivens]MBD3665480.1 GNAT family N-acetyltransferase [Sulfitobacter aestuariivivens]
MAELRTSRLLLRPARTGDAAPLHAVFTDRDAMKFWSTLPHDDIAQTEAFVAAMINADRTQFSDFVVEHEGRVIGKAGFWQIPEIGFIFHRDTWGQGLASEALRALIRHGFTDLGLARIIADVDPRNAASIGLLTKMGFAETGRASATIRLGDEWCDSIYFALPRPQDQS